MLSNEISFWMNMMEQHETSVGKEKLVPNLGQDIVNASGFNCVNTIYSTVDGQKILAGNKWQST